MELTKEFLEGVLKQARQEHEMFRDQSQRAIGGAMTVQYLLQELARQEPEAAPVPAPEPAQA